MPPARAPRPSAQQLRDWMNEECEIPAEYHPAIRDANAKMDGWDYMMFRQNSGSSIRGLAHLLHASGAFSDMGDPRPRWDRGYAGLESLHREW